MSPAAATYDLMLLLDPQAEDSARAKIVAGARAAIEGQGELVRHDEWGEKGLSYPIARRTAAEYHLLQFHAGTPELLQGLDRSLRIADEVLRFRIIKLKPGVPEAPDGRSAPAPQPVAEGASAPPPADAEAPAAPQSTSTAAPAEGGETSAPASSAADESA
jgi:small subunit ribosomal protein S6